MGAEFYIYIMMLTLLFSSIIALFIFLGYLIYKNSQYYRITKVNYFRLMSKSDLGKYGEYLVYEELKQFEKDGASFLFNCYIDKGNGESTEIDVLMIHKSGIYVFESKNYSGWIFGDSKSKMWTQTLPRGRGTAPKKSHFLNPILQNQLHIECLRNMLPFECRIHSLILFSDRCVFKKLNVEECNNVMHRKFAKEAVQRIADSSANLLTDEQCLLLYNILYPYSQTDDSVKSRHIDLLAEKYSKNIT